MTVTSPPTTTTAAAVATFPGVRASGVEEVRHDLACLDEPGLWVVVMTFEGALTAVRMRQVDRSVPAAVASKPATAPPSTPEGSWSTSLDATAYRDGVTAIREAIRAGEVYQVNLCRVLEREIAAETDLEILADRLAAEHPARYAARIHVPQAGLDIVSASPELFLARDGDRLTSGPIKGTAATGVSMLAKDHTENVMITDLVRNDLSPVAVPGTVAVEGLCVPEDYPGSTHLVSTVSCLLRPGVGWSQILASAYPPGSVSGAPKSTALRVIRRLEPVSRGPYCGALGYIDNATRTACLAVGIRTFWAQQGACGRRVLRFGTGAGITWGSDPQGEWCETVVKARRLVALAEACVQG